MITAFGTAMVGALIFLQKLRVSPDTAFSVNDWTAFVIFITVIGGIGRVEGPIIGTIVFFALRQTLADLGSLYLLMLGAVAIVGDAVRAAGASGASSPTASAGSFCRSSGACTLSRSHAKPKARNVKTGSEIWRPNPTKSSSPARSPARSTRRRCRTRCR